MRLAEYTKIMNRELKVPKKDRLAKAVRSAIWSVKIEGLKPTASAKKNLHDYAAGNITAQQMREAAMKNAYRLMKTTSNTTGC
jgi:hypothetical protein